MAPRSTSTTTVTSRSRPAHHPVPRGYWTFGKAEQNHISHAETLAIIESEVMSRFPVEEHKSMMDQARKSVHRVQEVTYGAHPEANDPTVRYTFVDSPPGTLWFTVRWWSGRDLGYYFDLVDVHTHKVLYPPRDLVVKEEMRDSHKVMVPIYTIERNWRLATGPMAGGTGEERYMTPEGSTVQFYRVIGRKEILVAETKAPMNPVAKKPEAWVETEMPVMD